MIRKISSLSESGLLDRYIVSPQQDMRPFKVVAGLNGSRLSVEEIPMVWDVARCHYRVQLADTPPASTSMSMPGGMVRRFRPGGFEYACDTLAEVDDLLCKLADHRQQRADADAKFELQILAN